MSLLLSIEIFLIFPVRFVERFITPSTYVAPASSASVASTALHECLSFGLRCLLHNCLAVIVEEVQSQLAVLGVSLVPGGEVILQSLLSGFHIGFPSASGKCRKGSALWRPQV